MKEFLKKINLVDHFTIELNISKNEFFAALKEQVDEGSTSMMSVAFDVFSSGKNEYKGHVGFDDFKIRRRRRFFDTNMNFALATGTFRQKENTLIIETEINGFSGIMIPFYIFLIIFYAVFIVSFSYDFNTDENAPGFVLPFILIHAVFMFGLPYFIMRRSTRRMKHELEREFYFITRG